VRVKIPNFPKQPLAHQVNCKSLNLISSASKPNIKNLAGNFEATYVGIMYAKSQLSSFNGGGEKQKGGRQAFLNRSLYKISKLPPRFARDG